MQNIEYMGCEYDVPDWAKFIATDASGAIYIFDMMPEPREDFVVGFWDKRPASRVQLVVRNAGLKWQETLVKIEE